MSEPGPWPVEPRERLRYQEAERAGLPFLLYRGAGGVLSLHALPRDRERLTLGRGETADVVFEGDERVSRVHARLELMGDDWTITDDGLSRNGTFVNGERVRGRRRLRDRDVVRLGTRTLVAFRQPGAAGEGTAAASEVEIEPSISPTQARVLRALCRPTLESGRPEVPATNEQIAAETFLSVSAVKGHLRRLFHSFGIDHLPQNQKRARLVRLALESNLVRSEPER